MIGQEWEGLQLRTHRKAHLSFYGSFIRPGANLSQVFQCQQLHALRDYSSQTRCIKGAHDLAESSFSVESRVLIFCNLYQVCASGSLLTPEYQNLRILSENLPVPSQW